MSRKRKKAQQRILSEIKSQLTIKAKKLGIDDRYSGINFDTMKLEAAHRIHDDLNMEKLHLNYELRMKGTLDKESTIKLEKINTYLNKAQRVIQKYESHIERVAEMTGVPKEKVKAAVKKLTPTPKISIQR